MSVGFGQARSLTPSPFSAQQTDRRAHALACGSSEAQRASGEADFSRVKAGVAAASAAAVTM